MRVILAGYNVDSTVLEELQKNGPPRSDVTPETLSAAYARISRDPRSVDELRAAARSEVERARRSNQTIIFKMGHHSVAEHAVFNFDIIGVSRLAIEELEKFRLCSYTEKSQRYIKLEDDFILPEEIKQAGRQELFIKTIKAQNALYHRLDARLKPYFLERYPEMAADRKKQTILDGWAKEDARYAVSLATVGQLGFTANARNLELLIRRFACEPLAEIRELNQKIYALSKEVAPSIILFTEANDFDAKTYPEMAAKAEHILGKPETAEGDLVLLVDYTRDADVKLTASLMHTSSTLPYAYCRERAAALNSKERLDLVKTAFQHMEFFDAVLREFEYINLTFDLIVSATCFAQLKRHRMATLTAQDYNPGLGFVLPPSIIEVGERKVFTEMMETTESVYRDLKAHMKQGSEYVLTNAHQRRVLLKMNAREFYHFSRLREDETAQWDIRRLAVSMSEVAKKIMPLTFLLLGGKDAYPYIYKKVFGKPPKLIPSP